MKEWSLWQRSQISQPPVGSSVVLMDGISGANRGGAASALAHCKWLCVAAILYIYVKWG